MITYFQKLKEGFVSNLLMHNNLSWFSNGCYGLGDTNASLKEYFL